MKYVFTGNPEYERLQYVLNYGKKSMNLPFRFVTREESLVELWSGLGDEFDDLRGELVLNIFELNSSLFYLISIESKLRFDNKRMFFYILN